MVVYIQGQETRTQAAAASCRPAAEDASDSSQFQEMCKPEYIYI